MHFVILFNDLIGKPYQPKMFRYSICSHLNSEMCNAHSADTVHALCLHIY